MIESKSGSAPSPGRSRVVSERSTPDDPSEVRRIVLPGAFRRTSQRSCPGRTHDSWSCRRHRFLISLRGPSHRYDHEMVRLARRPRPAPEPVVAGRMPWRDVPSLASTPQVWRRLGWVHCRIPWPGGRPSPTWGHARSGRDRHRRVPPRLSGGPEPRQQADHRIVAALPTMTCSCPCPGGKTSISQRAHTIGRSQTASRTDRSARRPLAFPSVKRHRWSIRPAGANLRPADARAGGNRANPINSRPHRAASEPVRGEGEPQPAAVRAVSPGR
jgi:hypothetical protein